MKKQLALAAAILCSTIGLARAADTPSVIEMRKVGMGLEISTFAGIRAVIAAKGDLKTLEGPARSMQRWARMVPRLFPKGSETGDDTKARPEIWADMAGFEKAANVEVEALGKLMELAKAGDADGITEQVKVVGAACSACHNAYRAK
jgi:cytochrome c556